MEDAILNFSRIEDDPFAKTPLNSPNITATPNEYYAKWNPTTVELIINYTFVACQLVNFFLAIAAVLADALIIYLIFRYKRLRKGFNLYIAHYAIFNLAYHLLAPIYLIFLLLFSTGFSYVRFIFCSISMTETVMLFMSFLLALLLAVDWTLSHFKPHYIERIQGVYNFKFAAMYVCFAALVIVSVTCCSLGIEFGYLVLTYSFIFLVLILSMMHYMRRKKTLSVEHLKTEYALWVSTIAIGCYVPIFFVDVIVSFFIDYSFRSLSSQLMLLLEYIFSLPSTPTPVFVLYYLNKWNKYFKMAFDTTFKRTVRTYGADNLDDASDNEDIVENGVERSDNTNINEPNSPYISP